MASLAGLISLKEALEAGMTVANAARERGFDKILVDCLSLTGELSLPARYELGREMAAHCLSQPTAARVAVIGKLPIVTGFSARLAANRGLTVQTFSILQPALDWLNEVDSKANAS